jgi:predicted glycoside hydrolase/deacetylase ChbG (UPF0249 family)
MAALQLVITADDLGIDPRRDDGILAAFTAGAVTQASLMVGGPSAASAAHRAEKAGLRMGLHLDLTELLPLADRASVHSLLDAKGAGLGKHGLREAVARDEVALAHVAEEASAQLKAFEQLTGRPARHVDGHQHTHVIPGLVQTLADVFAQHGVRSTRIPEQNAFDLGDSPSAAFYRTVSAQAAQARAVYARRGVYSTQAFTGLDLMGSKSNATALAAAVASHAGRRSVELMCHVGYAGASGDDFNRSADREHELQVLTARPFGALLASGFLQLASFDDLFERQALC